MRICMKPSSTHHSQSKVTLIILLLGCLFLPCLTANAQSLRGMVCGTDSVPVSGATVIVSRGDSVIEMTSTGRHGEFALSATFAGEVLVEAQAPGYEPAIIQHSVPCGPITIRLKPAARELSELVVEGDRSQTVQRLANGQRFFLSKQAREESDPFVALAEIPGLVSNPATMSLTMANGTAPFVLIDGSPVNSGIAPVNPADIESVEVINSVSARYLAQGVKTIVNIKLKKHRAPFVMYRLNLDQGIPRKKSGGSTFIDIGNEKFSFLAFASLINTHKERTDGNTLRQNTGYEQSYGWQQYNSGNEMLGYLMLKLAPTDKDYFALKVIANASHSTTDMQGSGLYTADEPLGYSTSSRSKDAGSVVSALAYYKHEWSGNLSLEVKAGYNNNSNDLDLLGREEFGARAYDKDYRYRSQRHSGNVDIDLTRKTSGGHAIETGYHAVFLSDKVRLAGSPDFNYRNTRQYAYGAFSGSAGKLFYAVSAGAEGTWLNASGSTNFYLRPRANASLTYAFNPSHSLQLAYTCTNEAPETSKLNPHNTSTDSLVVSRGNPGLTPMTVQDLGLTYAFNRGAFYSSLSAGAYRENDLALPSGQTGPDGVYVSTYANQSYYNKLYAALSLSHRVRFLGLTANLQLNPSFSRKLYRHCSPKDVVYLTFTAVIMSKRLSVIASATWNPRDYTNLSETRYTGSDNSLLSFLYRISRNLSVGVRCTGIYGAFKKRTVTRNGTYCDNTFSRARSYAFYPSIQVSWTIVKRAERKINLDDVLPETEQGIRLK